MNGQNGGVDPDSAAGHEPSQELRPGDLHASPGCPFRCWRLAIIVGRVAGLSESYRSETLTLVLSFTFYTLVSLGTLFLIGRSFLASGTPGLLLLECGVVLWSLAGTVGDAVSHGNANINVTIFNTGISAGGTVPSGGRHLLPAAAAGASRSAPVAGGGLRARLRRAVVGHACGAGELAAGLLHPGTGRHAGALLRAHLGHRHVRALRQPVARQPARGARAVYLLVRPRSASAGGGTIRSNDPVVARLCRKLAGPHGPVARRSLSCSSPPWLPRASPICRFFHWKTSRVRTATATPWLSRSYLRQPRCASRFCRRWGPTMSS